ncbi:MAG: hypothetical protein EAS48_03755, partial [Chryseobacterium sp.]
MCYYVDSDLTKRAVKEIYGVQTDFADFKPSKFLNGFSHPQLPIIMDETRDILSTATWGLIPFWGYMAAFLRQIKIRVLTLTS